MYKARYNAAVTLERLAQPVARRFPCERDRPRQHRSESARETRPVCSSILEHDRIVKYEAGDGGMVRTESHAGKVIRHEAYRLARGEVGHFEVRDQRRTNW